VPRECPCMTDHSGFASEKGNVAHGEQARVPWGAPRQPAAIRALTGLGPVNQFDPAAPWRNR
jgi:hypothetical protein